MATLNDLRGRVWSRLMAPTPPPPSLEDGFALASAEEKPGKAVERSGFSVFDPQDLARAMTVVAGHMRRADAAPDAEQGLVQVLDFDQALRNQGEDPELLDHALEVFLTHHPRGRLVAQGLPRLVVRRPEMVAPSTRQGRKLELRSSDEPEFDLLADSVFSGGALPAPDGLEWFREDPFANEHHTHWHVVYPSSGLPDPANPNQLRPVDKQGELFFYMHQQMLARYDAERRALGLAAVDSFADFQAPMALGYDPGDLLRARFGPRPPGRRMVPNQGSSLASTERSRDRLNAAVAAGRFQANPPVAVTSDRLGATIEANFQEIAADPPGFYGNLHNDGHILIANASDSARGVMRSTATAIRDPVFWRWHRHIDDFYAAWQGELEPRNFDDRPLVRLRKGYDPEADTASSPDVFFLFEEALPIEAEADLAGWAAARFGGDHWDDEPAADPLVTSELETWMTTRPLTLSDRVTTVDLSHLVHRPFVTLYRIENPLERSYRLTLRTFLVPREACEVRRAWIELDKFSVTLGARERGVFTRRGAQSVVIRKPGEMMPELLKAGSVYAFDLGTLAAIDAGGFATATKARLRELSGRMFSATDQDEIDQLVAEVRARVPAAEQNEVLQLLGQAAFRPDERPFTPPENAPSAEAEAILQSNYCTCGWPYNLLLPRGTVEGAGYRLAVIASDGDLDQAGGSESCGSLSFCGARDRYPDRREMGYPFDLPMTDGVRDTFLALGNAALTDFTIRRLPDVEDGA